jgi:hypothetical protein
MHTHIHTQASKHTHTHTQTHAREEHTHTSTFSTHAHKTRARTHARKHTRTEARARNHANTYKHTHTYIYIYSPSFITLSSRSVSPCPSRPLVRRVALWNPHSAPFPVSSATHSTVVYCVQSIEICSPAHDNDFASDYISPLCLLY